MTSFVHSFRFYGTNHIAKEYRKLKRHKPHIFSSSHELEVTFEQTSWLPTFLSSRRRSSDVTTDIHIFNILNFICLIYLPILYIFIYLFIYLFLFIYFLIFRRPPSVSSLYRHPPAPQWLYLSMYIIKSLFHINCVNTIGIETKVWGNLTSRNVYVPFRQLS